MNLSLAAIPVRVALPFANKKIKPKGIKPWVEKQVDAKPSTDGIIGRTHVRM
jgi:hypothetical protein